VSRPRPPASAAVLPAIVELLAAQLPGADRADLLEVTQALTLLPVHARQVSEHLNRHPDALVSGDGNGPAGFNRLLEELASRYEGVRRPRCGRCRQPRRLPYRDAGRRVCRSCYDRSHRRPCVRCGQPGQPTRREDGGTVCAACYRRDPDRHETCTGCGRARLVCWRVDGRPWCQNCGPRRRHTCARCGRADQLAHAHTSQGPVCDRCYHRDRAGECARCGRVSASLRLPSAGNSLDQGQQGRVCERCWTPPTAICVACGQLKPCGRGYASGRPICSTCRSRRRPRRSCFRCGQPGRSIQTTLPLGPVCGRCVRAIRRQPARCGRCGHLRPIVAADPTGAKPAALCGPCSGDPRPWTCRHCGAVDLLIGGQSCLRCLTGRRLDALLSTATGDIHPQLGGLRTLLLAEHTPEELLCRLNTDWARLLGELAVSGESITHATLDARLPGFVVAYLRRVLVGGGVLPLRVLELDSLEPWVEQLLGGQPAEIAMIVRPYASWSVLRRARARAAAGTANRSARKYARTRISAAVAFLGWLDGQGQNLATAAQGDVDRWLAAGRTSRYRLRDFLRWTQARRLTGELTVPALGRQGPPEQLLDDDLRWAALRRCLTDPGLSGELRVAGALVLLYGQQPSRLVQLTTTDLTTTSTGSYLALSRQPVLLPPVLAELTRELARVRARASSGSAPQARWWLFPSPRLDVPADPARLTRLLNDIGIYVRPARGAALVDLAADLPAPVLAELLGIAVSTATRWSAVAARDWTEYLSAPNLRDPDVGRIEDVSGHPYARPLT
jgi:hypothetical protein